MKGKSLLTWAAMSRLGLLRLANAVHPSKRNITYCLMTFAMCYNAEGENFLLS